jgi:hypothetical protein
MHFQIKYAWYLQNISGFIISEKIKTIELFKLYFLQNSPLVHLYISARDCKGAENITGTQFVKAFSALPLHSSCL